MPIDTVELLPNTGWDQHILVCRCGKLVDVFIVVTQRYVIFVDTLINSATALALCDIARPYLAERQPLVINSHADWDHAWGNHVFAQPHGRCSAPIIASRACAERLRSERMAAGLAQKRAEEPSRFDDVVLTPPTVLFEEHMVIDGGDLTLELFATPGHTHDHIAIFIPEISTLLAGDAAEMPFPFVESAQALPLMRASLARMAALKPTYALYCHAPTDSGPAVLQRNLAYFDTLEQRCRAALAQGISIHTAHDADLERLVGFPYEEAAPAGTDGGQEDFYRPGHVLALRAMLEWLTGARRESEG